MSKAIGMIETRGLIGSIEATDAMLKAADVHLVKQVKVDAALVAVLVEGDVGAVQAAVEAGKEAVDKVGELVAFHVIPHPDEEIKSILKKEENNKEVKLQNKPKKEENKAQPTVDKLSKNKAGKTKEEPSSESNKKQS